MLYSICILFYSCILKTIYIYMYYLLIFTDFIVFIVVLFPIDIYKYRSKELKKYSNPVLQQSKGSWPKECRLQKLNHCQQLSHPVIFLPLTQWNLQEFKIDKSFLTIEISTVEDTIQIQCFSIPVQIHICASVSLHSTKHVCIDVCVFLLPWVFMCCCCLSMASVPVNR